MDNTHRHESTHSLAAPPDDVTAQDESVREAVALTDDEVLVIDAKCIVGRMTVLRPNNDDDLSYSVELVPDVTRGEARAANRLFKERGLHPLFSESVSFEPEPSKPRRGVLRHLGLLSLLRRR